MVFINHLVQFLILVALCRNVLGFSAEMSFVARGFVFQTYARAIVGLTMLTIVLIVYLGRMRFVAAAR